MTKKLLLILILVTVLTTNCSQFHQAEYKFIGQFEYEITNDSLFNNTYLTEDSFGYVIGDLNIQGLKIMNIEKLDKSQDYILSLNNPIEAAYTNSEKIQNESYETKLKPLDIVKNKKIKTKTVYIYLLSPKGKYRLLVG
jgi:hypothetical protein